MDDLVRYEQAGDIALITMDDGKANALSHPMIAGLREAVGRAEREAKAIVLTGRTALVEGKSRFCAGFDLKTMIAGPEAAGALLRAGAELYLEIYLSPLPIVMACTGHALAGGALLLLVGDSRLGSDGPYQIGLNEVRISMTLPVLAVELARARIAPHRLTEACLHATIYAPTEAAGVGYLDRVVPPGALFAQATEEATKLAAISGKSYAGTKRRLRAATAQHIRSSLDRDFDELLAAALG